VLAPDVLASDLLEEDPRKSVGIGAKAPPNPLVGIYKTSDARMVMLNMLQGDRYWAPFCKAMEREDLIEDPKYATFDARAERRQELGKLIRETFAGKPLEYWREQLTKHECVWTAVQTPLEAARDRQTEANQYLAQNPAHARGRVVASPVQYNDGVLELERGAPELGQHTEEVLQELGLDWDQISKLKEKGVIT
jgi:crotonobetainyl-CoA:carnitine CoA-transferase CaiB-like acyl-CoA transferase